MRNRSKVNPKYEKNHVLNGGNDNPSRAPLIMQINVERSFGFSGRNFKYAVIYFNEQTAYAEQPFLVPM